MIAALFAYMLLLAMIGDKGRIINVILLLLIVGSSVVLQSKIYTAPLLFESFSDRLLFTFRDDILAEDFARLNGIEMVYDAANQGRPVKPV